MANNKNWSQIGDEIEDIVRSALESKDFRKLNETIARTVDDALYNVEGSVQRAVDKAQRKMDRAYEKTQRKMDKAYDKMRDGWRYGTNTASNGKWKNSGHGGNSYSSQGGLGFGNRPETARTESAVRSSRLQPGYEKARDNQGIQFLRERFRSTSAMNSTGIVLTACGYSFLGILVLVLATILGVTLPGNPGVGITTAAVMTPFIVGSGFMAYKGTSLLGRTKRFRRYVETLGEREFCQIQELADSLGKSQLFVKKDLVKMIGKRLFLHGHMDRQQTCLMVTDNAYRQYQSAEKQLKERQKEEQQKAAEAAKFGRRADLPEEARKVIAAGKEYLTEIQRCNDRIPGVEISEKISRLELVITKIFNRVEQHPELVDDLGRFMDYYLPTTVKLLKAYEELDGQPVQGDNIRNSKKQIEDTLDTIDQAFENLLDSFFEEAAWDISSDISVLHNMFAQEGLTESEFEKIKANSNLKQ